MARLSLTEKAGIVLVAAPCLWLGTWAVWHYTRSWEPVDIPISLSRGHIRTPVKIQFESDYLIYLTTREAEFPRVPCSAGRGECLLDLWTVDASWSLRSAGKVVADSRRPADLLPTPDFYPSVGLGRFHADRGPYVLDLYLLNDLSALNPNRPRLHVMEDGGRYYASIAHRNSALLAVLIFVPLPLSLLILSAAARRREKWLGFLHHWTLTQPGPLPGNPVPGAPVKVGPWRRPKQAPARTFSVSGRFNINDSTFFLFTLLMLLWTIFVQIPPFWPHGFAIRTLRPGIKLVPMAGIAPLRIRVIAGKPSGYRLPPILGLQVGSQVIDPANLAPFLRREIPKRPPDWPVYIEGDPDLEYQSVAQTIDAVKAFRANVVLLTPGLKAELAESRAVTTRQ